MLDALQNNKATVDDLQVGSWKRLQSKIAPPNNTRPFPTSSWPPCSGISLVPASGQLLDKQGRPIPVPEQQQYQDWLVQGVDYFDKDGMLVGATVVVAVPAECAIVSV